MLNNTMNTQDAVSANFAECFVTLNGTRYSMLMAKEFEGKVIVRHYLQAVGLWEEVKDRLHTPAGRMSIGQQQRLCLARSDDLLPDRRRPEEKRPRK